MLACRVREDRHASTDFHSHWVAVPVCEPGLRPGDPDGARGRAGCAPEARRARTFRRRAGARRETNGAQSGARHRRRPRAGVDAIRAAGARRRHHEARGDRFSRAGVDQEVDRVARHSRIQDGSRRRRARDRFRLPVEGQCRWSHAGCHRRVRRVARHRTRLPWRPAQHARAHRPGRGRGTERIPGEIRHAWARCRVRDAGRGDDAAQREDGHVRRGRVCRRRRDRPQSLDRESRPDRHRGLAPAA